jgi:hypothetical protein
MPLEQAINPWGRLADTLSNLPLARTLFSSRCHFFGSGSQSNLTVIDVTLCFFQKFGDIRFGELRLGEFRFGDFQHDNTQDGLLPFLPLCPIFTIVPRERVVKLLV